MFDGAGCTEPVLISGPDHLVLHYTYDDQGGFHGVVQFNPQGITGVGQVTGTMYRGTGVTRQTVDTTPGGAESFTVINNVHLIGQGAENNYLVHATVQSTTNANGEPTAEVVNLSTECRG